MFFFFLGGGFLSSSLSSAPEGGLPDLTLYYLPKNPPQKTHICIYIYNFSMICDYHEFLLFFYCLFVIIHFIFF